MLHFYTMLELCARTVEIWRLVFMLFCFSLYGSFDHLWTMVTLATVQSIIKAPLSEGMQLFKPLNFVVNVFRYI